MKNLWTTIMVKDMSESLKFYNEILGLPIVREMNLPETHIVFLGEGETQFELIELKTGEVNHGDHVSTGFLIENTEDFMTFLASKGVDVYQGPFQPNPHIKFFYIKDPNGYKIQLVEQL